jgi:hypothetical protein
MDAPDRKIKQAPKTFRSGENPKHSRDYFVYFYFALVIGSGFLSFKNHFGKAWLAPVIRVLIPGVLIYRGIGLLQKAMSIHGILLIISLVGSTLGDLLWDFGEKNEMIKGLVFGVLIMSRILQMSGYIHDIRRGDVHNELWLKVAWLVGIGILTLVGYLNIKKVMSDAILGLVVMGASGLTTYAAALRINHTKWTSFVSILAGSILLMFYDFSLITSYSNTWNMGGLKSFFDEINQIALYLLVSGSMEHIKFFDVEGRKLMTDSFIKKPKEE